MELIEEIETYLATYRRKRADIRRRPRRADDEDRLNHVAYRLAEIELGIERNGLPIGWMESRTGPPRILEPS